MPRKTVIAAENLWEDGNFFIFFPGKFQQEKCRTNSGKRLFEKEKRLKKSRGKQIVGNVCLTCPEGMGVNRWGTGGMSPSLYKSVWGDIIWFVPPTFF